MHFAVSGSSEDGIYYVCRRGVDVIAYFGVSEVRYAVGEAFLKLEFPGSSQTIPVGEEPTGSVTNYMYGNDPSMWRTGLMDCAVLRYADIYPGIDLVYRFLDGSLKYEFVVAPNADPGLIRLKYSDADSIDVRDSSVTIWKNGFAISDCGLLAFQEGFVLNTVECGFRSEGTNTISLSLGKYDTSCGLVVDPILLAYSSFVGGSDSDQGFAIAVEDGFVYVGGRTWSSDFPTVNPYQSNFSAWTDCFIIKLAADGQTLAYSTFLGGSSEDGVYDIAVENGFAYIAGYTRSDDFPTANAYDSTYNGPYDCFVTKLAADGRSLNYSTYLGGTGDESARGIAVENGFAYVTGNTGSSNFPNVTAYDSTLGGPRDCFLTKFAANGQSLVYSTFLGGSQYEIGYSIAVESGSAYVAGYTNSATFPTVSAYDSTLTGLTDGFVTKFAANGQSLVYSTFLGGTSNDESVSHIDVENGFAYVTGTTIDGGFPTVNAYDSTYNDYYDTFVTKLATNGQSLVYSTYLGGLNEDRARCISVTNGSAYVTGRTSSSEFPTVNAHDFTYSGGSDCFVTQFAVDGQSLTFSTFLGGSGDDEGMGVQLEGDFIYAAGIANSTDFPTVDAYDSTLDGYADCFVAIFSDDKDMDGLSDWGEEAHGTNPLCIDSDNDNFLDGYEVAYGSNATDPTSYPGMPQAWYDSIYEDLDGNATQLELVVALVTQNSARLAQLNASYIGDMGQIRAVLDKLGVTVGDTDYDGLDDLDEIALGTDLQCIDTDCDNLNDAYEVKIGTDPIDDDSDSDTYLDGVEVMAGTNPLDAFDYPGSRNIIIVVGAAGLVGIIALLIVIRRRTGARGST
ncbi:MAG: hypothetical protein C4K49_01075 [Candidatus Thorarchaeota archaeon]|nr:MAG: hypothetical protein C4K49_01075 [Candidatus Thorarchaeota archaeon]